MSLTLLIKLMEVIPNENVRIKQLARRVGIDHRTIKRHIDVIIKIQEGPKISKVQDGFRVLVRKDKCA